MDVNLELSTPGEPVDLRERIRQRAERNGDVDVGGVDWESFEAWWGNRLQSYLWSEWKDDLKDVGFSWQSFLKVMSFATRDVVFWVRGDESWDDFVDEVVRNLERIGP